VKLLKKQLLTETELTFTRPVFLSIAGGNIYALLRSLLSPAKPQEKTFAELAAELKKHFESKRLLSLNDLIFTEETRHQMRV